LKLEDRALKLLSLRFVLGLTALSSCAWATSFTVPSFENPYFTAGDINGQNGWGYLGNSPTLGTVVAAPSGTPGILGSQSLHLTSTTNTPLFGVANGLFSWRHEAASGGETGTGAASNTFTTSFFYRTPDAFTAPTLGDTLIAFNPAFRPTDANAADRYAFFGVTISPNNASQYSFLLSDYQTPSTGNDLVTVDNINPATWYRIEYSIVFNDGLVDPGVLDGNNDVFTVNVYDIAGLLLGTSVGGTWEAAWATNSFGGGTGPRAVNSMDFLRRQGPGGISLGYIDNLADLNEIPEPSTFILGAGALALIAGLRRRNR
jgi:hypothetical protein